MIDNAKILKTVRIVGNEFAALDDDTILSWIELSAPLAGEKVFGNLHYQAVAFLTCHKMKMTGMGNNETGAVNKMLNVTSYAEGDTNIGYSTNQSNNLQADAEYTLTSYGMQFLTLKQSCVVPILISGMKR